MRNLGFGMRNCFSWVLPILIVIGFLAMPSIAVACPNCKDGLHQNYLAFAFGASVLFMMAMPFTIMAVWAYFVYHANRSVKQGEDGVNATVNTTL